MLYLIKHRKANLIWNIYYIYETHTESIIKGDEIFIIGLINKSGLKIENVYTEGNKVKIKPWPNYVSAEGMNEADRGFIYVLLGRENNRMFKLVNTLGDKLYVYEERLKELIEADRVENCTYEKYEDKETIYKSMDTFNIKTDSKFTSNINKKYEEFRAKTLLLGLDISFEYIIENDEVKITKYTGKSKRILLPNFITTICKEAFKNKGITSLELNVGLKYIGNKAFEDNHITDIRLPKTLELVGQEAFQYNGRCNVYKKSNSKTIIIKDMPPRKY